MVRNATIGALAVQRVEGAGPAERVPRQPSDKNSGCCRSVTVSEKDVITAERADTVSYS